MISLLRIILVFVFTVMCVRLRPHLAVTSGVADGATLGDIAVTTTFGSLIVKSVNAAFLDDESTYRALLESALLQDLLDDFVLVGSAEFVFKRGLGRAVELALRAVPL
jgi:hypothetical protein